MLHKSGLNLKRLTIYTLVILLMFSWMIGPAGTTAVEYGSFIVRGSSSETAAGVVESYGGVVTSHLKIINGVGALLPFHRLSEIAADPAGLIITPNALVKAADEGFFDPIWPETDYPNVVGADLVWEGIEIDDEFIPGVTGEGVTVAVLDTGMSNHQAVIRDIYGVKGRVVGWKDFVDGRPNLYDPNGHGTHVAGIIGATQIGTDEEWNGVAPGVNLFPVRVLNRYGEGTYEQVIQGIEWVVDHKEALNVGVMNLSLVALAQSPYWADPLNLAVMRAWAEGIVVVAAAGNGGPDPMTIGVPGNVPYVITVGAFTDNYTPFDWNDDYLAPFSAAGPTLDGFVKPDVVAPGSRMVAPMNPGAQLALNYPDHKVNPQYFSMAGTSQAAAVVSGIAAMILDHYQDLDPPLTPDQVKFRIMVTALPWIDIEEPLDENSVANAPAGYSMWQQGAGRVNAVDAVFAPDDFSGPMYGNANFGLDISLELIEVDEDENLYPTHYQGWSCFDGYNFRLMNPPPDPDLEPSPYCEDLLSSPSGYGVWSGDWMNPPFTGGYGVWSGGYGVWSGGYGVWSGGYGVWSGGYGVWSGGYGVETGGYGVWSGGYGVWSGGYGVWSGGYGVWSGYFGEEDFYNSFIAGDAPLSTVTSLGDWVEGP
jgi:serine protease AprX